MDAIECTKIRLTANQIRCLLAVNTLAVQKEEVASKDVAKLLGITKPSVHKALGTLIDKGLLMKEFYGTARFTPVGTELASRLSEQKEKLQCLFVGHYGLSTDEAALAATQLMSELSEESLTKLENANR